MLFKSTLFTSNRVYNFGQEKYWVEEDGMFAQIDNQTIATWVDYANYHDFYAIGYISQNTLDYYKGLSKKLKQ